MNGQSNLQPATERVRADAGNEHKVCLTGRAELDITGVTDVYGFDETFVTLATTAGSLDIEGTDMAVQSLSLENGRIRITGQISVCVFDREKKEENGVKPGFRGRQLDGGQTLEQLVLLLYSVVAERCCRI